jgi:branched-chain amino acid transport system substrate-binding protein
VRVYVSLPLTGPAAALGRDVLRGAELAHERSGLGVEVVALDSHEGRALENARRAAGDPDALAYLGDLYSMDVPAGARTLGPAGLLQVAPVATWAELAGPTLVRLMPHDGVGARAIAAWLDDVGVRELLLVHDHDDGYGVPVGGMCAEAAGERGLSVRSRPVWDHDEPAEDDLGDAEALLYVGVAGSGVVDLWMRVHRARPEMWLLGTEGVAQPWLAAEMDEGAAERTRFFVANRAPFALYGHEAMALALDSIAAGGDRAGTVAAARATRDRDSPLGRYSIDPDGLTTCTAYGRLAVVGGRLVWDTPFTLP